MSSFLKKLTNPKTGKEQVSYCIDGYYGGRNYGYGFRKDGEDATIDIIRNTYDNFDWFREEELID
jgi:hypothetical protein